VDNLTLIAVNGPTSTAVLPGGVIIDNSGVTLSGFHIDGESTLLGETFGVYVNTGATGATVTHNIIEGNDTNPSRGVVAATGLSGVTVTHNEISDWLTGVTVLARQTTDQSETPFTTT
jgi:nitrous oxidase accessory protein NosD